LVECQKLALDIGSDHSGRVGDEGIEALPGGDKGKVALGKLVRTAASCGWLAAEPENAKRNEREFVD
jgi:hypothetical protein